MTTEADELFQRVKATVGQEAVFTAPEELGRSSFRKYALAVEDSNPIYTNYQFARSLGLHDIVAPPTLICDSFHYYGTDIDEDGYPVGSRQESPDFPWRAGNDYEFFQHISPEDVITMRRIVKDVWQKPSRSGSLVFQQIEVSYQNQHGNLLARNVELLFYKPAGQSRKNESA